MNLLQRHRFVLTLAIVLCLVLAGYWAMHPRDAVETSPALVATIPTNQSPAQPPSTQVQPDAPVASEPLHATGTFRGRVIDAVTNASVKEFELTLLSREREPQRQSFRTDDGRFRWEVRADRWAVTAAARGYQRFELHPLQISAGATTKEIALLLRPGYTLRGFVYDEASREGIAGASVGFREAHLGRFEGNWRNRVAVRTQKDGTFVLEGVPEGRVTLAVDAGEYAGRELDVVVSEKTAPPRIGLSSGGTIVGYLAAADGSTPIPGAVGLFSTDRGSGTSSPTGKTGEFSYKHLPAGRYRLSGQAEGRSAERQITLADGEQMDGIVLALSAGHSIRGLVTGLRPDDLERVRISVYRDNDAGGSSAQVGVDARGAFALHGVEPGHMRLVGDVNMRRQMSKPVEMPADVDLTVNLDFPRGARLTGQVTLAGKPLSGAWLEPRSLNEQDLFIYGVSTSARGEYAIEDLPAGEYFVRIGQFRSRTVKVTSDSVFDIDVPLTQLSGRVIEDAGTAPIVDTSVEIWSARADSSTKTRLRERSDHYGQFAFAGLEPGEFVLTAYRPGYEMYRQQISYGSPMANVTIRLRKSEGVEIRMSDAANGKPLREVQMMEIIGDRNGMWLQLHLDEDGATSLPGAMAGSTLSFSATGYLPTTVNNWNGDGLDLQFKKQDGQSSSSTP